MIGCVVPWRRRGREQTPTGCTRALPVCSPDPAKPRPPDSPYLCARKARDKALPSWISASNAALARKHRVRSGSSALAREIQAFTLHAALLPPLFTGRCHAEITRGLCCLGCISKLRYIFRDSFQAGSSR